MKSPGTMRSFTMLAAAALLAACGSDSNTGNGGTTAGTSAFTRGVVTAFGSVHLGDKVFTTSTSTVRKRLDDGAEHISGADNEVFHQGMVVEVFHKSGDTTAVEIRFKDDLEGPITAQPGTGGATFNVLGVPVLVDANTQFDTSRGDTTLTLAALALGHVVEVSGLFDSAGVLHATFIEGKAADATDRTFEIKGNIANLTGTAPSQTFTVNGVPFRMNATTQTSDLPAGGLANGLFVEVSGLFDSAGVLHATFIEGKAADATDRTFEIKGSIANLTGTPPNLSFKLGATSVTTSSSTTGLASVTFGAHVEAEGPVVNGTINALTIGLRP